MTRVARDGEIHACYEASAIVRVARPGKSDPRDPLRVIMWQPLCRQKDVRRDADIAADLPEENRGDVASGVHRYGRGAPVGMTKLFV